VIGYSPMASGLLTGTMTIERAAQFPENDWRSRSDDFKSPKIEQHLKLAAKLDEIASRHGRTAGEAAIAWTLRNPCITGAIVGVRTPEQVNGTIGAMSFRLSESEIAEIEAAF